MLLECNASNSVCDWDDFQYGSDAKYEMKTAFEMAIYTLHLKLNIFVETVRRASDSFFDAFQPFLVTLSCSIKCMSESLATPKQHKCITRNFL